VGVNVKLREATEEAVRARRDVGRSRTDAEAATAAKSQFLATMSHEIRTPINAVIGYAELLDVGVSGTLTDRQREYVRRIWTSSRHLSALVDEILDLAKIDSGRIVVAVRPAALQVAVREAVGVVRSLADARHLDGAVMGASPTQTWYQGDEQRVRQILINLLSNAIKFTTFGGRITVRCATAADLPNS
jgi:signal transduction histidine kinase